MATAVGGGGPASGLNTSIINQSFVLTSQQSPEPKSIGVCCLDEDLKPIEAEDYLGNEGATIFQDFS